jgi:hypothetical protein
LIVLDRSRGGSDAIDVTERGCIENQFPRQRQRIQFTKSPEPSIPYRLQVFYVR